MTSGARVPPVFSAAASYYGVADLRELAAQTHDFESHYLDGLIGPLPGFEYVYAERSPLGHVTSATSPVLLLQGLDDPVVPPAQARSIAGDLAAHGIRHALLTFRGESHGFRRAGTIISALQAELSFYGQVLGFDPPGIPRLTLTEPGPAPLRPPGPLRPSPLRPRPPTRRSQRPRQRPPRRPVVRVIGRSPGAMAQVPGHAAASARPSRNAAGRRPGGPGAGGPGAPASGPAQRAGQLGGPADQRANSVARDSRTTVTLIWPG